MRSASTVQQPNLYFSDDRTIAINSTKKEAKELYATQAVIDAANVRLQTAGSDFELNVEGGTHITDGVRNTRLLKVTPRIRAHETNNSKAGYETRFCTHVSMEVAQLVFSNMAASYHSGALFKRGHTERFTPGGLHATPVNRLVDIVSQVADAASSDMSIAMKKAENHEEAGKDFGKLAKDKLETAANALGINRHARTALVAEGYATFSTGKSSGTRRSRPG